jgi:hypothetical protein
MSIEAMKQWREALAADTITAEKYDKALKSIDQAIAEMEKQEPKCVVIVEVFGKDWRLEYMSLPVGRHKLYAQQYLYTHPQPKQEPLTHEQIKQVLDDCDEGQEDAEYILAFARAIEAAHGITSDMKQEHVAKTAKQRHEENT